MEGRSAGWAWPVDSLADKPIASASSADGSAIPSAASRTANVDNSVFGDRFLPMLPCPSTIPVRLSWKCTRFVISSRWPRS